MCQTSPSGLWPCFAGSRGEEVSEEDPQIDIATVQDMLSSHHYKSFKVSMIHRLRFTTDVQLGKSIHAVARSRKQQLRPLAVSNSCLAISGPSEAIIITLVHFLVEHLKVLLAFQQLKILLSVENTSVFLLSPISCTCCL